MNLYELVFTGQLVPGAQLERVRANMGKLFQADEQRLELLFSGRRLVLKNNLDSETAEKYRATLEKAGAWVEVLDMNAPLPIEEVELAPPPDAPTWLRSPAVKTGRLQIKPRDAYMAAFAEVDAPDLSLAEVGAQLVSPGVAPVAPALDLSQLSIAPVGSDMGPARRPDEIDAPDTSHLKLV